MSADTVICNCMDINKEEIIKVVKEKGLKTAEEIGEAIEAGTVCEGCVPDIEEIIKEIQ